MKRRRTSRKRVSQESKDILEGVLGRAQWTLIHADVLTGLKRIPDSSISCIVTSPPYYWQRDYGVVGQLGHEKKIEEYVASLRAVFSDARRTLKSTGIMFLVLGDTYYSGKGQPQGWDPKHKARAISRKKYRAVDRPGLGLPKKSLIGVPWRVALALQADGWVLRSSVTWKKTRPLAEPNATDRPWRGTEQIFIFAKSGNHYFNRKGLGTEEDIWVIDAPSQNGWRHAAPFPEELVRRCLACGCPPRGKVLDPFVGSGTTTKVAISTGRSAIGIDLNRSYIRMASRRLSEGIGNDGARPKPVSTRSPRRTAHGKLPGRPNGFR